MLASQERLCWVELLCSLFYISVAVLDVRSVTLLHIFTCRAVVMILKLPEIYVCVILLNYRVIYCGV
jgi:hypothetical protein